MGLGVGDVGTGRRQTAYRANLAGLGLVLLLLCTALLQFALRPLLPPAGGAGAAGLASGEWRQGLYGLLMRVLPLLPSVILMRRAARAPGAGRRQGGRLPPALLWCLFLGAALAANGLTSLARLWVSLGGGAPMASSAALPETGAGLALFLLGSCLAAPVMEELFFRGGVQALLGAYGARPSILATAALFTLLHSGLWDLPATFLLGLVLCYAWARNRSLGLCVGLHMANNLLAFGALTLERHTAAANALWAGWAVPLAGLVLAALLLVWPLRRLFAEWTKAPGPDGRQGQRGIGGPVPGALPGPAAAPLFAAGCVAVAASFVVRLLG